MTESHGNLPVTRPEADLSLRDLAETAVRSGYFRDAKQASQAAMKMIFGREIGLGPGASMRGIHVFDGRMELASSTMTSLINQAPNYELEYVEDPTEANQWTCTLRLWRLSKRTGQWEELPDNSWTKQDTERAGLSKKDNWQHYPGAMAFSRCLSQLFRRQCPELGAGPTYAMGEVHEAQDAELVEVTSANGPAVDELSVRARADRCEKLSLDRDAAQARQAQPVQDGPTIDDRPNPTPELDTAPVASSSPVAADVEPHPEDPHDIDFEATEQQPAEQPDRVDLASLPRDALLQEISRLEGLNGASEETILRNRKGAGFRGGALHAAPMAQLLIYAEDLVALNSI